MISDDELILYYYRDGLDAADRARIGEALSQSPELAQRLHRLVSRLDAAAAIPEVPVPEKAQQRWRAALEQAAQGQTTRKPSKNRNLFTTSAPWLAAAAAVLVAIAGVLQYNRQPPAQIAQGTPPPAPSPTSAYERGLATHLAATEQQLVSLEKATPEQRAQLVDTIVEQNRIYALAAERAGEPQLARVLRAFSPVLESLKTEGGDTAASVDQLAFEFRVMQGRLGAASSTNSATL